ncbi:MAG TPA: ATP-binding protein [Gaiellaceae bacterium]|nr:ATP-binding protein [Gaiellaceae bacterium]
MPCQPKKELRRTICRGVEPRDKALHALVTTVGIANTVVLVVLAALALQRWRLRREATNAWLASAFLAIAAVTTVGRLVPQHPHGFGGYLAQRTDVELLVLFPYLLYRFATEFVPPGRRLQLAVASLTVGLSIWTFALPHVPASGQTRPGWFVAYVVVFFIHWTGLSIVVTTRLWRAGRGLPSVARNRMRMLGFAAAALTVALLAAVLATNKTSPGAFLAQLLAFVAIVAFVLGIEPPQIVRVYWRVPEQLRLQEAMRDLVTLATTRAEIAGRIVTPAAALVGARGLAVYAEDGELLAAYGTVDREGGIRIEQSGVTMVAWTSPYAPFFGEDELRALEVVAALTATALDRVRLFQQEHEGRLALERANEVMANFVALAAHELRTPVTTVHGFVQTLNHLGDRLDETQKAELRVALEQQTQRMASLVEQLLDLSRLDADAIDVRPEPLDLRRRLHEVVSVAAAGRLDEVEIEVAEPTLVVVDPQILDHIVSNLVTNALRYGHSPVRVTASAADGQLRVFVEDSGPGVAREIEETLFDRFTRAGVSRDRVAGTGLGLAIARAYAVAHRGDLRYERGQPSGARFVVELPSV